MTSLHQSVCKMTHINKEPTALQIICVRLLQHSSPLSPGKYTTTMAKDMTVYWGAGSPPCWRVIIALEEKNLQGYNSKELSFQKGEHKGPEVMKINPRGQVSLFSGVH